MVNEGSNQNLIFLKHRLKNRNRYFQEQWCTQPQIGIFIALASTNSSVVWPYINCCASSPVELVAEFEACSGLVLTVDGVLL
jgi:hypothetical protein